MSGAGGLQRALDRASLAGIGVGLALLLQPWWDGGLRAGFFVTLAATLLQTVAGHLSPAPRAPGGDADGTGGAR